MNKKIKLIIICIIMGVSMLANVSIAAVDIEGVPTSAMDEIVVSPLLADYSWDQR